MKSTAMTLITVSLLLVTNGIVNLASEGAQAWVRQPSSRIAMRNKFTEPPPALVRATKAEAVALLQPHLQAEEQLLDADLTVTPLAGGELLIEGTALGPNSARRIAVDATGASVQREQALATARMMRSAQLGKLDAHLRAVDSACTTRIYVASSG